jgi:hypothetical protein
MCGMQFASYTSCIKCKTYYNLKTVTRAATACPVKVCSPSRYKVIGPLVDYEIACGKCQKFPTSLVLISKCAPLLWDEQRGQWSNAW